MSQMDMPGNMGSADSLAANQQRQTRSLGLSGRAVPAHVTDSSCPQSFGEIPQKSHRATADSASTHHRQINLSPWVKFTDLLPVPARSSLRPPKSSPRRSPRPPRVVLSSVTSTSDDSLTSP